MHAFPIFDDTELEIDEVLDSIAWDLCGRSKHNKTKALPKNDERESAR